mmetsp:Transcript_35775/g.93258  ORF Transcript_35775/g.93258 Transcript_35775/m.93258 type:complete len:100 (-) Transcript_35775:25-324(-)
MRGHTQTFPSQLLLPAPPPPLGEVNRHTATFTMQCTSIGLPTGRAAVSPLPINTGVNCYFRSDVSHPHFHFSPFTYHRRFELIHLAPYLTKAMLSRDGE